MTMTDKERAPFVWRKRGVGSYRKEHCPECGTEYQAGQITQLFMPYCGACGKAIADAAHIFCGWCGVELEYTVPPKEDDGGVVIRADEQEAKVE